MDIKPFFLNSMHLGCSDGASHGCSKCFFQEMVCQDSKDTAEDPQKDTIDHLIFHVFVIFVGIFLLLPTFGPVPFDYSYINAVGPCGRR